MANSDPKRQLRTGMRPNFKLRDRQPSRFGRPFDREGVAGDGGRIAIAPERPKHGRFCPLFVESALTGGKGRSVDARLFFELPSGRHEQILDGVRLAFGDRPRPVALVDEIRSAGMGQEDSDVSIPNSVHQQSRTDSRHRPFVLRVRYHNSFRFAGRNSRDASICVHPPRRLPLASYPCSRILGVSYVDCLMSMGFRTVGSAG